MFGFTIKYGTGFRQQENDITHTFKEGKKQIHFAYHSFSKFSEDKFFLETEDFILGFDGVLLNAYELKKSYAAASHSKLFLELYAKQGIGFVNSLKGEFCGVIFDKTNEKLFFYNNKTATKQVFYACQNDGFIIAPSLQSITAHYKEIGQSYSLDISSVYDLLSFGGMLENYTLLNDVHKLNAGEYLELVQDSLQCHCYYDYNNIKIVSRSKKELFDLLSEQFLAALDLEYKKDQDAKLQSIATLSGGLDSRMNVMLAQQQGFHFETYCFSQSKYLDEKIAQQIADDLKLAHQSIALDGSPYLRNVEQLVQINSGLQDYNAAAHYHFALSKLALDSFGLMHTGQLGDGIFGGYVATDGNYFSKAIATRFLAKTRKQSIDTKAYRDAEVFKLYQRAFNFINVGAYIVESQETYLVSPFLDTDFLETALSIAPALKINQKIYLEWINERHKTITNYKWERTGMKPNATWKTELARYTKKIENTAYKLLKKNQKLSMTPDAYWYKQSLDLKRFYHQHFNENIDRISDKNLQKDLQTMFLEGNLSEKSMVLTVLEAAKQFDI